jgi:hypothetical protein
LPVLGLSTLPSPEAASLLIVAVLTGLGVGAGSAYRSWRKAQAEADAEAFRITEEARKGSTLAALEDLTAELKAIRCRLADRDAEIVRLKADRDADARRAAGELAECREEAEKLRAEVYDFAIGVLHRRGFVELAGGGRDDAPAPQPQPPQPSHGGPDVPQVS